MDGRCDVPGCTEPGFMGWRPLSENRGRQICERHWLKHKDPNDSFDLFDAFGLMRPAGIRKPGAGLSDPGRKGQTKRRLCPGPKNPMKQEPTEGREGGCCRACGAEREAGHTYCEKCRRERRREANQDRQRRFRVKRAQVAV